MYECSNVGGKPAPSTLHGKSKSGKLACLPALVSISFGVFEANVLHPPYMHFVSGCGAARVRVPSYKIRSAVGEGALNSNTGLLALGLPWAFLQQ